MVLLMHKSTLVSSSILLKKVYFADNLPHLPERLIISKLQVADKVADVADESRI